MARSDDAAVPVGRAEVPRLLHGVAPPLPPPRVRAARPPARAAVGGLCRLAGARRLPSPACWGGRRRRRRPRPVPHATPPAVPAARRAPCTPVWPLPPGAGDRPPCGRPSHPPPTCACASACAAWSDPHARDTRVPRVWGSGAPSVRRPATKAGAHSREQGRYNGAPPVSVGAPLGPPPTRRARQGGGQEEPPHHVRLLITAHSPT